jgi:NAD(P)-dependent dehydrogenase (short-subunit alcohol dehydrogenase family)
MERLDGKFILITGASQGLGRQLAIDFAREGAAAISIVARRGDALKKVSESVIEAAPETRVLTLTADLSKEEEIERVVATTLNEFNGRLDVLINNASSIGPTPLPYLMRDK